MRLKDFVTAVVVVAALAAHVDSLAGQSLADVARQEQERRKNIKATSKVLTNKDLGAVPAFTPPATPPADGSTPAITGDAATTDPAAPDVAPADPAQADAAAADAATEQAKDQAAWSGRAKGLQTQLSRDETFAIALQSRINALTTEYTNQSDPVRQAALATERQKAVDELNRLTRQIADDKKAIAALQEEARRAGVPAGWLR